MEFDAEKIVLIKGWLRTGSINIFGVPFSGKDTQGIKLAELFDAQLIGGGDILRNNINVSPEIKDTFSQGFLIPQDEYLRIITPYLSQDSFKNKPIILSSVGRWQGEEQAIIKASDEAGHPTKAVIFLNIDEALARQRSELPINVIVRGQRQDDRAEFVSNRLDEFSAKTLPVIEFYRQKGILIEVDGSPDPDIVTSQIIEELAAKASKN